MLQEPFYEVLTLACLQEYQEGGIRIINKDYCEVWIIVSVGVWCDDSLFDELAFGGCDNISNMIIKILKQKVVPPSAEYGVTVCRGCQSLMQMKTSSWLQA